MIRSVFLSHGAPLLALDAGPYAEAFRRLGELLRAAPRLVFVSPHWTTRGLSIGSAPTMSAVHDFGGFPSALYQLRHTMHGDPEFARRLAEWFNADGIPAQVVTPAGLDHGVWIPHRLMALDARQAVIQVSMPQGLNAARAYALGQTLAVHAGDALIIGSGGMTHDLQAFRGQPRDAEIDPKARAFATWMHSQLSAGDHTALLGYRERAPFAVDNHPTDEHLLPLFIALGAAGADADATRRIDGFTHGILSMAAYSFARRAPSANSH